jgi:subtilisin
MKKILVITLICLLMASNIAFIAQVTASSADKIPVVIGFKNHMNTNAVTALVGNVNREYSTINAVSVSLPEQAIDALKKNPNVAYIDNDITFMATDPPDAELTNSWGVYHIGAGTVQASGNSGVGINVAVIDTGINYNHLDLIDRYKGGWNFVANNADPNDDNGHGSHCAGIIAATDNVYAVVGVAPQANIYAVKVLDRTGTGSLSNIVAGIDWATKTRTDGIPGNDIQIISMSLGSSTGASSLQAACDAAYNVGIVVVAASGNNGISSVSYPANYASVIAVGASDSLDRRASFSNYGSKLELIAPGVNIISDYIDTNPNDGPNLDTLYMSGTSMACPHVAGTAALVLASPIDSAFDANANGIWDASEVRSKLDLTAKDLGTAGRDIYYGYGLVDAIKATTPTPPDTTPPTITALTPANGATVYVSNPTISAKATDPSGIGAISMTFDGNTVTPNYSGDTIAFTPTTLADGTHSVALTVSDQKNNQATQTWSFTVNTQSKTMHVESITMKTVTSMLSTYATATIKIVDANNNPLKGAIVTGQWSGATTDRDTATTSSSGTVTLQSDNVRRAPTGTTYTITVKSVQLTGYTFTPGTDTKSITK